MDFAERFRLGGKKVSWGWLSCDCVSEDGDASERYGDDGARISGGGRKEGRKEGELRFHLYCGKWRDLSAPETKQRLTEVSCIPP